MDCFCQLCALAELHSPVGVAGKPRDVPESSRHRLAKELPALYERLAESLALKGDGDAAAAGAASGSGDGDGDEASAGTDERSGARDDLLRVRAVLHARSWLWTGTCFVPSARVAFACPANAQVRDCWRVWRNVARDCSSVLSCTTVCRFVDVCCLGRHCSRLYVLCRVVVTVCMCY